MPDPTTPRMGEEEFERIAAYYEAEGTYDDRAFLAEARRAREVEERLTEERDDLNSLLESEYESKERIRKEELECTAKKIVCHRGHSLEDAYRTPDGRRNCVGCRRTSDKKRYYRAKA